MSFDDVIREQQKLLDDPNLSRDQKEAIKNWTTIIGTIQRIGDVDPVQATVVGLLLIKTNIIVLESIAAERFENADKAMAIAEELLETLL
jgi:hypothetical protein